MIDSATKKEMGITTIAFGYGLLTWGMVDRPLMMIVAAAFLLAGYAAVGQSVPPADRATPSDNSTLRNP